MIQSLLLLALVLVLPYRTLGEENSRSKHRFGLYMGVDTPFPATLGPNVAYHLYGFARISAGVGIASVTKVATATSPATSVPATTTGASLNLFLPSKNFSPTLGIGYSSININVTEGNSSSIYQGGGFYGSNNHTYAIVGVDWVSTGGFYLAIGVNTLSSERVNSLPYFNFGGFF